MTRTGGLAAAPSVALAVVVPVDVLHRSCTRLSRLLPRVGLRRTGTRGWPRSGSAAPPPGPRCGCGPPRSRSSASPPWAAKASRAWRDSGLSSQVARQLRGRRSIRASGGSARPASARSVLEALMISWRPGLLGVLDLVDGEVDPLGEGAPVDPLLAGVPALDAGGVHQGLPHGARGAVEPVQAGADQAVSARKSPVSLSTPGDQLGRGTSPAGSGPSWKKSERSRVRITWRMSPSDSRKALHQGLDRLPGPGAGDAPGRHLGLVGDEEVVQVAGR